MPSDEGASSNTLCSSRPPGESSFQTPNSYPGNGMRNTNTTQWNTKPNNVAKNMPNVRNNGLWKLIATALSSSSSLSLPPLPLLLLPSLAMLLLTGIVIMALEQILNPVPKNKARRKVIYVRRPHFFRLGGLPLDMIGHDDDDNNMNMSQSIYYPTVSWTRLHFMTTTTMMTDRRSTRASGISFLIPSPSWLIEKIRLRSWITAGELLYLYWREFAEAEGMDSHTLDVWLRNLLSSTWTANDNRAKVEYVLPIAGHHASPSSCRSCPWSMVMVDGGWWMQWKVEVEVEACLPSVPRPSIWSTWNTTYNHSLPIPSTWRWSIFFSTWKHASSHHPIHVEHDVARCEMLRCCGLPNSIHVALVRRRRSSSKYHNKAQVQVSSSLVPIVIDGEICAHEPFQPNADKHNYHNIPFVTTLFIVSWLIEPATNLWYFECVGVERRA